MTLPAPPEEDKYFKSAMGANVMGDDYEIGDDKVKYERDHSWKTAGCGSD